MSYNNWKCSHGHTKDEHPSCFEAYIQAMAPNTKLHTFIEDKTKEVTERKWKVPEGPQSQNKTWEPKGVGALTKSGKMIRLDIFGFEPSPLFLYLWVDDAQRVIAGTQRNFKLLKLLHYSERKKEP